MNVLSALVVGVLFGAGVQLMVRRDAVKVAAGSLLVANAAILLLVSGEFSDLQAPFVPIAQLEDAADPLLQALAITAIVIGFGTTVLLFRITLAIAQTHDSLDMRELVAAQRSRPESEPAAAQSERES